MKMGHVFGGPLFSPLKRGGDKASGQSWSQIQVLMILGCMTLRKLFYSFNSLSLK